MSRSVKDYRYSFKPSVKHLPNKSWCRWNLFGFFLNSVFFFNPFCSKSNDCRVLAWLTGTKYIFEIRGEVLLVCIWSLSEVFFGSPLYPEAECILLSIRRVGQALFTLGYCTGRKDPSVAVLALVIILNCIAHSCKVVQSVHVSESGLVH